MKRRTIRAGMAPVSGPLRRILPLLLQTLLVVALVLPAGFAVAPAFLGPRAPADAAQSAPAWHQVPGTLAASSVIVTDVPFATCRYRFGRFELIDAPYNRDAGFAMATSG